ncbi:MAG: hypothetical protein H0V10_13015 [Geodermatophilaceae bacterium]|nr:hypothetical protein [Geodermatophilaceae bacterium]
MSRRRLGQVGTVLGLGLFLGGLGFALSLLYEAGVPLAVCLIGGVLVSAAGTVLSGHPVEDAGDLAPGSEPGTEQRSSFGDLHTLQARLAGAGSDPERFEERVRRPLADLTAERLRQRHDLDWLAQPSQARETLDPLLWALLTAPSGRFVASRAQVETWVTAIERL